MSKLKKVAVWLCITILICIPVFAVVWLSEEEQKEYLEASDVVMTESAYGELYPVQRQDIQESINVSGSVISKKNEFMELTSYGDGSRLRFVINEGDFICENQIIAYYKGTEVRAQKSGIVKSINIGEECYISLESVKDIELKIDCTLDKNYKVLKNAKKIYDTDENEYKIDRIEDGVDSEGKRSAYLIPKGKNDLSYGQTFDNFVLQTEKVYPKVLSVKEECVYSYNDDSKKYIRIINDDGTIDENEVEVANIISDYAIITNVEEGTMCDSGYKKIVEGEHNERTESED